MSTAPSLPLPEHQPTVRIRKRISPTMRSEVWAKSDGHCWYCGREIIVAAFQIDHVMPVKAGGTNDPHNLVPSCYRCNGRKRGLRIESFRYFLFGAHKPFWFEQNGRQA